MKLYFIYRFKILTQQKISIFWAFIFPLLLTGIFALAMKNLMIQSEPNLSPIKIVVEAKNQKLIDQLEEVKVNNKSLFIIKDLSSKEAEKALKDEKIDVIVKGDEDFVLRLNNDGLEVQYLKAYLETFNQVTNTYTNIALNNQGNLVIPEDNLNTIKNVDTKNKVEDGILDIKLSSCYNCYMQ